MTSLCDVTELDIKLLKIFLLVIEKETLSAAADKLKISQPAISQALISLERSLSLKLFDRTRRPFGLTLAGEVLAEYGRDLIDRCDHSIAVVQQAARGVRPVVRIGMLSSFSMAIGSSLLQKLLNVSGRISIWSGHTCDIQEALLLRKADIIVSADRLEYHDGIVHSPILTEPFVLVVPRNLESDPGKLSLQSLSSSLPFIEFSKQCGMSSKIDLHFRRCKILPSKTIELESGEMRLSAIASGLGWSLTTPLCLLQGENHWAEVRVLPLPKPGLSRTLFQISRSEEHQMIANLTLQCSKRLLQEKVLPRVFNEFPWLEAAMSIATADVLLESDEFEDTETDTSQISRDRLIQLQRGEVKL